MKYAHFSPVDGRILHWMNAEALSYVLPPIELLHECTDVEWALDQSKDWMVQDGAIVEYVAPPSPSSPPAIPQVVSRAQGKAALIQAGLWQGVLDYVAAIEDDTQRALANVALHDTQEWRRDSAFLNAAGDAIGLDDAGMDALFTSASQQSF